MQLIKLKSKIMKTIKTKFDSNHRTIYAVIVIALITINLIPCFSGCGNGNCPKSIVKVDTLISIIKQKQKQYIRESRNEYDCFTSEDSIRFVHKKTPTLITDELLTDTLYISAVKNIKELADIEWNSIKSKCFQTYKPTWYEIGRVSSIGQTISGQACEMMIADAIVRLTDTLRKMDKNEFCKYYGKFIK